MDVHEIRSTNRCCLEDIANSDDEITVCIVSSFVPNRDARRGEHTLEEQRLNFGLFRYITLLCIN